MNNITIVIPAVKKNVAFPDDLVKKLAGIPLLQRTINKALELTEPENILVVTDSEEIRVICERNKVECDYDRGLYFKSLNIVSELKNNIKAVASKYDTIIILSPYSPLLKSDQVFRAVDSFHSSDADIMLSVINEPYSMIPLQPKSLDDYFDTSINPEHFRYADAFIILRADAAAGKIKKPVVTCFPLGESAVEIKSYRDWWVCEKLLARKRIVFRVIGNDKVGMGHIFRSLALAHEITDHEVIFVCSDKDHIAVNSIAGYDYLVEVMKDNELEKGIIKLAPDLVVNDILDTSAGYIKSLRKNGIKVVNFEDLGQGALHADLVINELYTPTPDMLSDNMVWGHEYYFLRDEFYAAKPARFSPDVKAVLLTFGGTDNNNLTMLSLESIAEYCRRNNIKIYIVAGSGYLHKKQLVKLISKLDGDIEFTHATGVISGIMEKVQIAITSNGRTVYELAHMNIPSIVVSHHIREGLHKFSSLDNGFVPIGVHEKGRTEKLLQESFVNLVEDHKQRRLLFDKTRQFDFKKNKSKVVKLILELVE